MAPNGLNPKPVNFATFHNVIDGQLRTTTKTRHGVNPATLEANPEVPVSSPKDVDETVAAAKLASAGWARVPFSQRQEAVIAFANALLSQKEQFGEMMTKEQGKPIHFAVQEVENGAHWLIEQAKIGLAEEIVEETADKIIITRHTPLGVALGIVPWNYPIMLACGKIAPALITGNAMIIKPSPFTPYCDLKLVELGQQFFPPGVLQVLSGDDDLGPWLTAHPGIDKVSFTGSTATGKRIMESCSKTLKRVTLELGGNDPAIICDDVDIEDVAPKIASLAFLNSGQICIAIKRIYVQSSIYPQFREAIVKFTKTLQVGDGFKPGMFLGPIQNSMQFERVKGFFEDAKNEKLDLAVGGFDEPKQGYFVNPTIVDNPNDQSRIVVEEPFGPIVPMMQWSTEEEVIKRANGTDMGLGASVWSKDLKKAERMARQLDAGSVWVNAHLEIQPTAAFGGHKHSGIGAEWGTAGLKSYCNTQTLFLKKQKSTL